MQHTTISMLKPETGRVKFYDIFYRNYSFLICSNLAAFSLIANIEDDIIFKTFVDILNAAPRDYNNLTPFYNAIGLDLNCPQTTEERGLDQSELIELIRDRKITARIAVTTFLNANEFILLFALFEDTVKRMLIERDFIKEGDGLKQAELMNKLKCRLNSESVFDEFEATLKNRSVIWSFEDAVRLWNFFLKFRNLFVHSSGRATSKWLKNYCKTTSHITTKSGASEINMGSMLLSDFIEGLDPTERDIFIFPDGLANIFRNFVVSIMETLYLIELRQDSEI